eukprot:jgi/Galph1/1718/GphlegSOOS_G406.1
MAANGRLNMNLSDTTVSIKAYDLTSPLVNRVQAVLQVLEAFRYSYVQSGQTLESTARPVVCFAGHMYGAGKTIFGKFFYQFLLINRQYIRDKLGAKNLPACVTSEESLDTLYNGTLYVYLNLQEFPRKGTDFVYTFAERICKAALSEFPNSKELLSEVLSLIPQGPSEWLRKLVFGRQRSLQFSDLRSPSSNEDSSKCDAIVRRQQDAMPSRISLRFLRLDPFSSDVVNDIVQQSRYGGETLREIIFPKAPQEIDWLSEIIWDYTGGVPIYVHYVLAQELEKKVETIHARPELFVSLPNMRPKILAVFSSMLLASVLEIPLRPEETSNSFGFYYSYGENPNTFKLVYPKIVLKYLEKYCGDIPMFRFISHLFSTTTSSNSPVSRELTFQVLFSLVLYLKLYFCSKLGEINIFQKTFVEDYRFHNVDYIQRRKRIPLPQYVASFSSTVCEVTATGLTYHPNAWNLFYDRFLSRKDGIFIRSSQHSRGPDLVIRLSKNITEETISSSQMADSTQLVTFSSQKGPIVYLIGISLKCYHLVGQGVGLSLIKNETEKFLILVAQQLDLETKNMVIIQVIVSTKYTKEVTRQFTDHQNWVLNSGIYYENDNGHICLQSLSSPPACDSSNEWLRIPSQAYSQLGEVFVNEDAIQSASKLMPLSSTLTSWLQGMLIDEPTEV